MGFSVFLNIFVRDYALDVRKSKFKAVFATDAWDKWD
jgi:hypothetical protein